MGSLSEHVRMLSAVHSIGLHPVWCPKLRLAVFRGRVALRLHNLLEARGLEHSWTVAALEATIRRHIVGRPARPEMGRP
jgi:hypothetical protein